MAIITNDLSYKEKETLGIKHTKNSFHKSISIEFIKRVFLKTYTLYINIKSRYLM